MSEKANYSFVEIPEPGSMVVVKITAEGRTRCQLDTGMFEKMRHADLSPQKFQRVVEGVIGKLVVLVQEGGMGQGGIVRELMAIDPSAPDGYRLIRQALEAGGTEFVNTLPMDVLLKLGISDLQECCPQRLVSYLLKCSRSYLYARKMFEGSGITEDEKTITMFEKARESMNFLLEAIECREEDDDADIVDQVGRILLANIKESRRSVLIMLGALDDFSDDQPVAENIRDYVKRGIASRRESGCLPARLYWEEEFDELFTESLGDRRCDYL